MTTQREPGRGLGEHDAARTFLEYLIGRVVGRTVDNSATVFMGPRVIDRGRPSAVFAVMAPDVDDDDGALVYGGLYMVNVQRVSPSRFSGVDDQSALMVQQPSLRAPAPPEPPRPA